MRLSAYQKEQKLNEYKARLQNMNEEELEQETSSMIYMSAWANNNPNSKFHDQCDACYAELKDRTGDDKAYSRIHDKVREEFCG